MENRKQRIPTHTKKELQKSKIVLIFTTLLAY